MSDLRTLTDAFAELERRADAATAAMPAVLPTRSRASRRLVPVAATVAAVAGLAAGAALLAPGDGPTTRPGSPATAGGTSGVPAPPSATRSAIPDTPEELSGRLRAVLGDTATFTVTHTGAGVRMTVPAPPSAGQSGEPTSAPIPSTTTVGAAIVGTLTASGRTGGFDLGIYPTQPGEQVGCGDRDPSTCTMRRLPDGSLLLTAQEPLQGPPNGITYEVELTRSDGVRFLMHLSNARDPKGESEVLAPQPPLTIDQMIAILTSDRW